MIGRNNTEKIGRSSRNEYEELFKILLNVYRDVCERQECRRWIQTNNNFSNRYTHLESLENHIRWDILSANHTLDIIHKLLLDIRLEQGMEVLHGH